MKNLSQSPLRLSVLFLVLLTTLVQAQGANPPAFPGAEGFGKYAKGGRGGEVYHVTNLNDDGPGSLRYGIRTTASARTIVFDVAGTIQLATPIKMENKSFLTIAGQTAPGKGITIRDHALAITKCSDVVVRYLRLRLGDKNKGDSSGEDVMTVDYCDRVILDHLSLSWGIDGNSDYRGDSNMTLQWLLYAEALHNSIHEKGSHAMCTSLRDCQGNTTLHHNVYSTSRDRHPTIGGGTGSKGYAQVVVDYRNCVDFNWRGPTNFGGMKLNVVNNYYKPGPCSDPNDPPMQMKDGDTTKARGFMVGNHFEGMPKRFTEDNYSAVIYTNSGSYMSTSRQQWASDEPFELGDFQPYTQSAPDAYEICLRYAGCSLMRDSVDERIVENIIKGRGELIDSQDQVGGWDNYSQVRRPDDWDTDRDGIPDVWEKTHGFDPANPADRNGDTDGDGYTNLEEYLNSLVPDMVEVATQQSKPGLGTGTASGAGELSYTVEQITRGPGFYFFGYIGQSKTIPWNGSGRYIIALHTNFHDRMPLASDAADIILIDTINKNQMVRIDKTTGWNFQQGTMFYWNPQAPETQFFFNDRDPATGHVFTVLYDIQKQRRIREYRFEDTPFGNSGVAQRGGAFLGLNYARMARLRPVTGYPGAYDWTKGVSAPADDGIFIVDVDTGTKRLVVSFQQLAEAVKQQRPDIEKIPLFINHTLWNRQDDCIYFYLRGGWEPGGVRLDVPFTVIPDGAELRSHTAFIGGHPEWAEGTHIIGERERRQVLYDVKTQQVVGQLGTREIFPKPGGDISLSPDGNWFVNGYSEGKSNRYVIFRRRDGAYIRTAAFDRGNYEGDIRIDPAPCWNRDSNAILVPGIVDGTRQLFVIRVEEGQPERRNSVR